MCANETYFAGVQDRCKMHVYSINVCSTHLLSIRAQESCLTHMRNLHAFCIMCNTQAACILHFSIFVRALSVFRIVTLMWSQVNLFLMCWPCLVCYDVDTLGRSQRSCDAMLVTGRWMWTSKTRGTRSMSGPNPGWWRSRGRAGNWAGKAMDAGQVHSSLFR